MPGESGFSSHSGFGPHKLTRVVAGAAPAAGCPGRDWAAQSWARAWRLGLDNSMDPGGRRPGPGGTQASLGPHRRRRAVALAQRRRAARARARVCRLGLDQIGFGQDWHSRGPGGVCQPRCRGSAVAARWAARAVTSVATRTLTRARQGHYPRGAAAPTQICCVLSSSREVCLRLYHYIANSKVFQSHRLKQTFSISSSLYICL